MVLKNNQLDTKPTESDPKSDGHSWQCPQCKRTGNQDMQCAHCGFQIAIWSHGGTA